jgi:hypothetical protein
MHTSAALMLSDRRSVGAEDIMRLCIMPRLRDVVCMHACMHVCMYGNSNKMVRVVSMGNTPLVKKYM